MAALSGDALTGPFPVRPIHKNETKRLWREIALYLAFVDAARVPVTVVDRVREWTR